MIRFLEPLDFTDHSAGEINLITLVEKIFANDESLEKALGFEYRPEQAQMAITYAHSLLDGKHLIFEAGTGVGKSLAYLVPSVIYSILSKRKCVIATNTINLQEQLLDKDIPAVRSLFLRTEGLTQMANFHCALLVGRSNYLCQNRLARALIGQGDLFDHYQRTELKRISEWVETGPMEGIRQELSPPPNPLVWDLINADSSVCSSKRCSPDTCFYRRARHEVDHSDLVVINHSLFFSLLGAGAGASCDESGVLFPDDFLVFDEAHEIGEVASDHLGIAVSSWAWETLFRQLYNPSKKKGLLCKMARESDLQAMENATQAINDFFQYIHVNVLGERDRMRIVDVNQLPMEIFPPLSRLLRCLIELAEISNGEMQKLELRDQIKRLQTYVNALSDVIEQKDKSSVYWIERGGRKHQIIYLRSAPIDIAPILKTELFSKESSILMTSATITRKNSSEYFRKKIGAEDASEGVVNSPFDYDLQMNVRICNDCPDPQATDRGLYLDYICRAISGLARSVEGGTLALFTNYADLRYCYDQIRPEWKKLHRSIYAQGGEYSRSELRKRVIDEGDALLLGAESFWKGFDAKGSCISQVIITRLPFENPSHPLLQARSEMIEAQNRSSFHEMTLPAAVMRFRQGVGRLIRSASDAGELIILDSRILNKSYGKDFLKELPKKKFDNTCLLDLLGC